MKKSTDIRTLKKLNKPVRYSIPDSRGLHLWVRSDGKKYWVYRYTFDSIRFDMGLGSFPDISLAEARITHQRLRGLLLKGVNPSDEKRTRRAEKSTQKKSIKFSKFAFDYIERMPPKWTNRAHEGQWVGTITNYAIGILGDLTLEEITTDDILDVLDPAARALDALIDRLQGSVVCRCHDRDFENTNC